MKSRLPGALAASLTTIVLTGVAVLGGAASAFAATSPWQTITTGAFSGPVGIAVDAAGDLFVTNYHANTVLERPAGSPTWQNITNGGAFSLPWGMAVDAAGDLFVTNYSNSTVLERPAGSTTWQNITNGGAFSEPYGMAVDAAGDLFVTSAGNNTVLERPAGSTTWQNITNGGAFSGPVGIAVDAAGDLFVTNYSNSTVLERPAGSQTWQNVTNGGAFSGPVGIALDAAGDLFVTNWGNSTVLERPAGSPTWQNITNGGAFSGPVGIALDAAGDLFVTNLDTNTVLERPAPPWTPPTLTPEPVTVGGTSTQVIGSLGFNAATAIQHGSYVGYVEERAAIEAGASFTGEGTNSSYLSAILSGDGVGLQQHVTAVQQGQFAALYQKLGIIPTWTNNPVPIAAGVTALKGAAASALAIENYLVQLDGWSWAAAQAQAAAGFPIQSGT